MNYHKLAFTEAVKKLQNQFGSRIGYERMENHSTTEGMSYNEISFIEERDTMFMATIGSNGYPYIQHRGGPKGFLKVIDSKTIAFLDFTGNKQYISVGNLEGNNHVALILMDFRNKARLKIFANAEIKELAEVEELGISSPLENYSYKAERAVILNVQAYDWNCPQHITPRFTIDEIELAFKDRNNYVSQLEMELEELRKNSK